VIVAATLAVGNALLAESTLSFLGLGFSPDVPTWGRMLYDAQNYIESAPHMVLAPGLAIFLAVLSINTLGDRLQRCLGSCWEVGIGVTDYCLLRLSQNYFTLLHASSTPFRVVGQARTFSWRFPAE
jgi:hypothetical protein